MDISKNLLLVSLDIGRGTEPSHWFAGGCLFLKLRLGPSGVCGDFGVGATSALPAGVLFFKLSISLGRSGVAGGAGAAVGAVTVFPAGVLLLKLSISFGRSGVVGVVGAF